MDSAGNMYGTTEHGGLGFGTVYELPVTGGEKVFYSFTGGADGAYPTGGLLRDSEGNLYGVAIGGGNFSSTCAVPGSAGCGVVFLVSPTGREKSLYTFSGGTDGANPVGGLIRDPGGSLHGTTLYGGLTGGCYGYGCGVVFKVDRSGDETVLHTFTGAPDGQFPVAALVQDTAGNLYGTTSQGGVANSICSGTGTCGVVFKIDASNNETILYAFTGQSDGANPEDTQLILDSTGNLYGTTSIGVDTSSCVAPYGCGVAFELSPTGAETILHTFEGGSDGEFPTAGLYRDGTGNLYGTTGGGGTFNLGTVFKVTPVGIATILHSFDGPDGLAPEATLLPYKGYLYGTTFLGGNSSQDGVVFKILP